MKIGTMDVRQRVMVIAEIGVNHDGSVERAIELVKHARACDADAIKLQLFSADRLVTAGTGTASYQQANCGADDQVELLRKYELSEADVRAIVAAASEAGLTTIATPFSREDVETIAKLGLPAVKVASPDMVNRPLLERCVGLGVPMLVSTGASTAAEIGECVAWLDGWRAARVMMHCVSSYPVRAEDAQLGWIAALAGECGGVVGYSDHTTEALAGAMAVCAGARVIEKHLTWSRAAQGPDHAASVEPGEFASYVRAIRHAEVMLGGGERRVLAVEEDVRRLSRQSLVARRPIDAGQVIEADMLTLRRPGEGIGAKDFEQLVGRRAVQDIKAGDVLRWEMLRVKDT
jgi:N,N'-diacetyllegionaminate synthase